MANKEWKYPKSLTIKDKDGKVNLNLTTKLNEHGVSVYIEDKGKKHDFNLKPNELSEIVKRFASRELKDGYSIEYGEDILVEEIDGRYMEIKEKI